MCAKKRDMCLLGGCEPPHTFFESHVARAGQEARFAEGRFERLPTLAGAWVRLPVDVFVTDDTGVLAARQATDTIPIVFAVFADPLAEGLVGSPDSGLLVITPVLNTDS
jgi:hypothetical protein